MRIRFAITAASFIFISIPTEINAQTACRTKKVAAGYQLKDASNYTYNCCQGYNGGSCMVETCKIGVGIKHGTYLYESKIKKSNCIGSYVG